MRLIKKSLAIAGIMMLMAPAGAIAQSSSEGYGGPGNVISGLEQGPGGGNGGGGGESNPPQQVKTQGQGGNLPFTGADLGVLAAAGGILAGLGFGLRRLTHRPSQA
jgi:hypothetical protein